MNFRLAHRVQRVRPSATVSITALAERLRHEGRDVISLSAGEADFPTPEHIRSAALRTIQTGDIKYTAIDGARPLKEAIAEKFRRDNGIDYELDQILVSSGAKQSCYNACQALFEVGDEVIIPAPYWVSYPDMVRLADGEPVIVHTEAKDGFRMTPEQLESALTNQTRALIINSPCNPSGAAYGRAHWEALGEVLREHPRVFVITDDIYEHIYWGPEPFCSLGSACPELAERTLTVNGVSKGYAMSGWRIGYAGGPRDLIKAMTTIQSQSTTSACTVSQAAAEAALNGDHTWVSEMCASFKARHDDVVPALNGIPGFSCAETEGTFYAFPRIAEAMEKKGTNSDVAFCERMLDVVGVAAVPGSAFGSPGHLRLSFACSTDKLTEAFARIAAFVG